MLTSELTVPIAVRNGALIMDTMPSNVSMVLVTRTCYFIKASTESGTELNTVNCRPDLLPTCGNGTTVTSTFGTNSTIANNSLCRLSSK